MVMKRLFGLLILGPSRSILLLNRSYVLALSVDFNNWLYGCADMYYMDISPSKPTLAGGYMFCYKMK